MIVFLDSRENNWQKIFSLSIWLKGG